MKRAGLAAMLAMVLALAACSGGGSGTDSSSSETPATSPSASAGSSVTTSGSDSVTPSQTASSVSSVSSAPTTSASASPADLVPADMKGKTLDAAIGDAFPPTYFRDADNKLVGFTPDLAAKVSEMLGIKFNYQAVSFSAVLPGIQSGKYQVALSSADITDERVAAVDMIPVTSGGYAVMVRADATNPPADLAGTCGKTVAITAGGNEANILADQSKKLCTGGATINVSTFPDQVNASLAVKSGRADAAFIGATTAGYMLTNDPGWKIVGDSIVFNNQGWIVPKGGALGPALLAAVNELIKNGTYQQLLDKWHLSQVHLQGDSILNKVKVG